jgi:hypothetical protein
MTVRVQAIPGEVVVSPDPLARAKHVARKTWPYAAGVVVVLVVLGIVFRHSLSWGDAPTWVLAITTMLAFLAAAFAGLVAYDLVKIENARDLKAADERLLAADERERARQERAAQREADRRAQANQVAAWFDYYMEPAMPSYRWGAAIRNASELPILDLRVFFYWVNDAGDGSSWTTSLRFASIERIRVVPPGRTRHLDLPQQICAQADECNDQVYLVGIEFTDAKGIRWIRDERGALLDPNAGERGSRD